jgi:glycosyltransferase involved in cell wall biosynthesis
MSCILPFRRGSPIEPLLKHDSIRLHEVALRNATDISSSRQLAGLIREHQIDILHAHVARDYPVSGLAARMIEVNLFLTRHHFIRFPKSRIYQWAISPARKLIAVSRSVAEGLAQSFPKLADRIIIIPNWVEKRHRAIATREQSRYRLGITRRRAVAVIGQISPIKRQDLFVRAAARLRADGFDDVEFLIIGEAAAGDAGYKEQLESLTTDLGVQGIVRLLGFIPSFSDWFSGLDLVLVPSSNEGFSLVALEAMTAGLPVVASRSGGLSEILEDGVTGILVPPDDLEVMVEATAKLLADDVLRSRLGEAAKAEARERFDREAVVDRIERLYAESAHLR